MLYGAVSTAIPCVLVLQEKDVKSVKTCVVQDIFHSYALCVGPARCEDVCRTE